MSIQNIGHFGLNLRRYVHFTSPIRRYADLLVHRALISASRLGAGGLRAADEKNLERVAAEISVAERRAMAAERDTVDRLIAFWLADRVGAHFEGRIRGVTRAGLFVELQESGADGFVPISTIGEDFYEYHEAHHRLVGRTTGETFRLGDAVEVRLVEALPYAGSLRLELLRERPRAGRGGEAKRAASSKAGQEVRKRRDPAFRLTLDFAPSRAHFTATFEPSGTAPMAKAASIKIRLVSEEGTGFFYVAKKNSRTMTEKLSLRKYDPKARKHVLFKEAKIK